MCVCVCVYIFQQKTHDSSTEIADLFQLSARRRRAALPAPCPPTRARPISHPPSPSVPPCLPVPATAELRPGQLVTEMFPQPPFVPKPTPLPAVPLALPSSAQPGLPPTPPRREIFSRSSEGGEKGGFKELLLLL